MCLTLASTIEGPGQLFFFKSKGHRPNWQTHGDRVQTDRHHVTLQSTHIHRHSITSRLEAKWSVLGIHCVATSIPTTEKKNSSIWPVYPSKQVCVTLPFILFLFFREKLSAGNWPSFLSISTCVCKDNVESSLFEASITLGCHGRMTHTRRTAIIVIRLATRAGRDVAVIVVAAIRRS